MLLKKDNIIDFSNNRSNDWHLVQIKDPQSADPRTVAEVLATLNTLVLERQPRRVFALRGALPQWFSSIYPTVVPSGGHFLPAEHSLFITNFMIDAKDFWANNKTGRLCSRPWSETDPEGREHYLEASAVNIRGRHMLLVECLHSSYRQMHTILQKARENNLIHQQLVEEVQKKEILLHCIVHDLSQPLTAMKGCFTLFVEEQLSTTGRRLVEIGNQQVRKQEDLIQDILQIFAAEMGSSRAAFGDTIENPDVVECVKTIVEKFAPTAALNQVKVQLDPVVDWTADWHVTSLDRVLTNLVENALHHTTARRGRKLSLVCTINAEQCLPLLMMKDWESPKRYRKNCSRNSYKAGSTLGK
ncbi:MAG: sensor histidine kinase [Candidatus Binatia bacterium]